MFEFINLLPRVTEKFTNIEDFHTFLLSNIECDENHKYKFMNEHKTHSVADYSVTGVLNPSSFSNLKMEVAAAVGVDAHKILSECAVKCKIVSEDYVAMQENLIRFMKFFDLNQCQSMVTELPMIVGIKINNKTISLGGTLDLLCIGMQDSTYMSANRCPLFLNFLENKTCTTPKEKDWSMQLMMYAEMYCFLFNTYVDIDDLNVTTDGNYRREVVEIDTVNIFANIANKGLVNMGQKIIDIEVANDKWNALAMCYLAKLELISSDVGEIDCDDEFKRALWEYIEYARMIDAMEQNIKQTQAKQKEITPIIRHRIEKINNRKCKAMLMGVPLEVERKPVSRLVLDIEKIDKDILEAARITKFYDDKITMTYGDFKFNL